MRSSWLRRSADYRTPSALRHHLGPRPERRSADHRSRAANGFWRLWTEKGGDRGLPSARGTPVALPVTILHPGHLVGPGWAPVNPAGNFNPEVFSKLLQGSPIQLPNIGMETLHHVHADDVAQCFQRAMERRSVAIGESFHVVSPAAVTLRGYAERVGAWFGHPAQLEFLPWEEWRQQVTERDAAVTWDHIAHSPNCSIAKARTLLGYEPRYSSLQAVRESARLAD